MPWESSRTSCGPHQEAARGDLRCPAHGAGEPGLADWAEESPVHRRREEKPAAAACTHQGPALAAGPAGSRDRATLATAVPGPAPPRLLTSADWASLAHARPSRSPAGGRTPPPGRLSRETIYAITSLTSAQATAADLARLAREHWSIEAHHHIRDVTFTEDTATSRTGNGPASLATIRAAIIAAIEDACYLHVPEGRGTTPPPPTPSASTASTSAVAGHVCPAGRFPGGRGLPIPETGPVAKRLRVREIDDDEGRRLVRIVRRGSGPVVTWRRAISSFFLPGRCRRHRGRLDAPAGRELRAVHREGGLR